MPGIETFDRLWVLDTLDLAVWLFDFDAARVIWANEKAQEVWQADSLEELAARDLSADMSPAIRTRLNQYKQDFLAGKSEFFESWTLYPHGNPVKMNVRYRGIELSDGRVALLCESTPSKTIEPDTVRSVDALLHTVDMVSLFSEGGELIYCNPAARKSFGQAGTATVQTLEARFVEADGAKAFLEALKTDGTCETVALVLSKSRQRWHRISGARCHDPMTGDQAYLITEQDVTDAEQTKRALEASRNEALEANQAKSDFVAVVSHELRTPLNGILGVAEILRDQDLSDQQRDLVDLLLSSGQDLLTLLNGVLDLSRLEAEQVKPQYECLDLAALTQNIAAVHETTAADKKITFAPSITGLAVHRRADRQLFTQILHNLLSNAIKFTEEGSVSLTLDITSHATVRLMVRDTGIGLSEAQIARVPEAFVQADSSISRRYGGTGLGLTIVYKLVESLGGTVAIESAVGAGTAITVTLPFERVAIKGRHDASVHAPPATFCASVLVVDDVATNLLLLELMLEELGLSVVTAKSATEALNIIDTRSFDLIMSDIAMPAMDGIAMLQAIRAKEQRLGTLPVPAVAVTANAFDHQIKTYLEAGFQDHLSKPLTKAQVNTVVARFLGGQTAPRVGLG